MAVASTSSEKTELTHSMGHSPSSSAKNPVADVKHAAADAASDTSSVSGISATSDSPEQSEPPTRKDVNNQLLSSARSEEYRQLFHLPPEEVLVQDFNCAFQESILIQGHMYLFVHHICFYSNIFGYETKKVIPLQEVTCVRKAKTAAIFPNAIEIESGGRKHFFASFLSRDEAYRLIVDGWSQNNINAKALLDYQEAKIDPGNQDNVLVLFEKFMNFKRPSNESDSVDRDKDADISEESNEVLDNENDLGVTAELLGVMENVKEEIADPLSCGEPLTWKPEDMDAPKIPNNYTMVAESKFPIQVEGFFNCFFSDGAVDFVEAFHRKCGDKDFQCTEWYEHEQIGQARDLSFQHPIKIYFGAKYGHCREVQKFRIYTNSHLVIETSQQVSDVPYGDYFRVEGLWDIERLNDEENSCFMRVFVNVSFLRKTMWKGKIEQSTMEECREAYALWINQAHERLKKRETFGKLEGVTSNAANNLLNSDIGLKSLNTLVAPSEGTTCARLLHVASDPKDVTAPVNDLAKGYSSYAASSALLFREAWATLCLYFRSRSNIYLLLGMALAAIFILTQLTIIVFLASTPKIHLIPQESLMSSFRNERAEAVSWMEKRVCHLKEEMFMVEARLERMHQEYILLKSHLESFQQFDLLKS